MKTLTKILIILLLCVANIFNATAQSNLALALKINDVLYHYQWYCRLNKDSLRFDAQQRQTFLAAFESENSMVFNDLPGSSVQSNNPASGNMNGSSDRRRSMPAWEYADKIGAWNRADLYWQAKLPVELVDIGQTTGDTAAGWSEVEVRVGRNIFQMMPDGSSQPHHNDTLYFKIIFKGSATNPDNLLIREITDYYDISTVPPANRALYISGRFAPGISRITQHDIDTAAGNFINNWRYGYQAGIRVEYFFNHWLGAGSGMELSLYGSQLKMVNYASTFDTTDKDNEQYQQQVKALNVAEEQRIIYLDLPLYGSLRIGRPGGSQFYVNGGFKFGFPVYRKVQSQGTFTYKGYYPQYNALLYDLDQYGYYTERKANFNQNLNLKLLNFSTFVGGGVIIAFFDRLVTQVGVNLVNGVNNISKIKDSNYQLSRDHQSYSSLMHKSSRAATSFIGLEMSVTYKIK